MPSVFVGVNTVAKAGSAKLKGDVTFTGGSNVTITQSGQDLSIAASQGELWQTNPTPAASVTLTAGYYSFLGYFPLTLASGVTFTIGSGAFFDLGMPDRFDAIGLRRFQRPGTNVTVPAYDVLRPPAGILTLDSGITAQVDPSGTLDLWVPPTIPANGLLPGHRLTLTPGTPVTTSDVTAATKIYYTPFVHDQAPLWTSARGWQSYTCDELTLAVPASTSQMYDVFLYFNTSTGQPAIESLAWTNDTTRATNVIRTNGYMTKSGDQTRLYVGSFRTTTVSGQTEDSFGGASQAGGKRFVWNAYNRVLRSMGVIDTTNSWTYTTATWRQANGSTGNKVEAVFGLSEDMVDGLVFTSVGTSALVTVAVGIGIDSTTTNNALVIGGRAAINVNANCLGHYRGFPGVGYHAFNWLEISQASGTTTWWGDNGLTFQNSGLQVAILA